VSFTTLGEDLSEATAIRHLNAALHPIENAIWRPRGARASRGCQIALKRVPFSVKSHTDRDETGVTAEALPPAFAGPREFSAIEIQNSMQKAIEAWLLRTPSKATQLAYQSDLHEFLRFAKIRPEELGQLTDVRPEHVAAWREQLPKAGRANSTVRKKLTVIRSLFSYLQVYSYTGANPAHGKFVKAPAVPRDGKTVGLSTADCRQLLDAPKLDTPVGVRDRAILGVLAYSDCRVGGLVKLRPGDFKSSGEHRVLAIHGKGGKERTVPLHLEAVERLNAWLTISQVADDRNGPLFRPTSSPRGLCKDGFRAVPLTVRAVEYLVKRYAASLGLDAAVTVHSLRVTALTTARERGSDVIDLQDFAGHADPRTTLTYIRSRDRLSKSPAYVLKY
jgi:integrase/recombinase XerD